MRSDGIERLPASVATGDTFLVGREGRNIPVPSIGQFASLHSLPLLGQVTILLLISCEAFVPLLLRLAPVLDCALHVDRKSTRLNSSHLGISYAVFCLKKKIDSSKIQAPYHIKVARTGDSCKRSP